MKLNRIELAESLRNRATPATYTLSQSLAELERTDPAVAKAAANLDRVTAEIIEQGRAKLATPATVGPNLATPLRAGQRSRLDELDPPITRFDSGPDIDVPVTLKPRVCPTLLVLPYPPSANNLYRTIVRGKRAMPIKSAEHRAYFDAVAARVGFLAAPWPKETPLAVTLRLFRPRRTGDIDGPIKALLDSLNGRAWVDDSQISELHVSRHDDKANPRVEVSITTKEQP